ncbi:hypothetical protein KI659_17665 [Litoribacter alkaliphilus]|uniref:Uncharacterized protein n=1 Tax=Litoribacter ruber TaxID=702568 RepID=A0AAP2CJE5_9BACT|nr:hypothetical protein [Litoribacter alkaliphilus]MBS9525853.1 hypothetical protein [Litoribacter alkaliphilus]
MKNPHQFSIHSCKADHNHPLLHHFQKSHQQHRLMWCKTEFGGAALEGGEGVEVCG